MTIAIKGLPLMDEVREALDMAADEALRMGDGLVGSDHLFLAVIRQGRYAWPRKPRLSYVWARRMVLRALGKEWIVEDIEITPEEARKMKRARQRRLAVRLKRLGRSRRKK